MQRQQLSRLLHMLKLASGSSSCADAFRSPNGVTKTRDDCAQRSEVNASERPPIPSQKTSTNRKPALHDNIDHPMVYHVARATSDLYKDMPCEARLCMLTDMDACCNQLNG
mmetsp:Transcript_129945/g.259222  ORF Transcript_129945/g.259222 Transcript_129945/m.259222 type:complete len:111 (+) Transcript_129945:82-414(+)